MAKRSDLTAEILAAAEQAQSLPESESGDRSAREQRNAARRIEAMSLLLAGLSYDQIGERLGITADSAHELIARNLERANNRAVEELRLVENARLDRAQAAIWGQVLQGDLKAVDTFLRISSRRSKLNGLDAPQKIALSANVRVEMEQALTDLRVILGETVDDDDDASGERPE